MAELPEISLEDARSQLDNLQAEEILEWASIEFESGFALTTSFGIQSAVLLNMIKNILSFKPTSSPNQKLSN